MRITCQNSESAFAAIVDAIRPGFRECDLVGIGTKVLYENPEFRGHETEFMSPEFSSFVVSIKTWSFV